MVETDAWWLCFTDMDKQPIGACIVEFVEGGSPSEAIVKAEILGLVPDSEFRVRGFRVQAAEMEKRISREHWHELKTRQEWELIIA